MIPSQVILQLDWLATNAITAYPICDGVTEMDTTQSFILPRELIVDLSFPVDIDLATDPGGFHLLQLISSGSGVNLTFGYTLPGSAPITVAQVNVSASTHVISTAYRLTGVGVFSGGVGSVTIGRLDQTLASPGSFMFDPTGARILPTCIRPDLRAVSSIQVIDGPESSNPLYGQVRLTAGTNVRLSVQIDPVTQAQSIRIDAIESTNLNAQCGCTNDTTQPPPITSINGIAPRSDGSFDLVSSTCITFTPDSANPGSLQVTDTCSTPCCGSPELQVVENDLNQLLLDVKSLESSISQLESGILGLDQLQTNLQATGTLGSAIKVTWPPRLAGYINPVTNGSSSSSSSA